MLFIYLFIFMNFFYDLIFSHDEEVDDEDIGKYVIKNNYFYQVHDVKVGKINRILTFKVVKRQTF